MSREYPLLCQLYPPVRDPAPSGQSVRPKTAAIRPSVSLKKSVTAAPTQDAQSMRSSDQIVDFIVYGQDEDDQTQEVHLAFRDDVVRGVYLKLRFETAGLRAIFLVNDKAARRWARAYGEQILARLEKKGMKTHAVEIIDSELPEP